MIKFFKFSLILCILTTITSCEWIESFGPTERVHYYYTVDSDPTIGNPQFTYFDGASYRVEYYDDFSTISLPIFVESSNRAFAYYKVVNDSDISITMKLELEDRNITLTEIVGVGETKELRYDF